eukprot:comp21574_c0_seq1/m.47348 comp21574_c0_seq1/g.47348  ORF comp21574_c0_seq1/g.47348 comp21574_c0_seq1/m.47348 type:complete len:324 (-) comp21574_c0_seq1:139-1110(-)
MLCAGDGANVENLGLCGEDHMQLVLRCAREDAHERRIGVVAHCAADARKVVGDRRRSESSCKLKSRLVCCIGDAHGHGALARGVGEQKHLGARARGAVLGPHERLDARRQSQGDFALCLDVCSHKLRAALVARAENPEAPGDQTRTEAHCGGEGDREALVGALARCGVDFKHESRIVLCGRGGEQDQLVAVGLPCDHFLALLVNDPDERARGKVARLHHAVSGHDHLVARDSDRVEKLGRRCRVEEAVLECVLCGLKQGLARDNNIVPHHTALGVEHGNVLGGEHCKRRVGLRQAKHRVGLHPAVHPLCLSVVFAQASDGEVS